MANVSLGDHFESLASDLVKEGRYSSVSEVLRAGMRMVEEQEKLRKLRLELLARELKKGMDSGSAGALSMEEIKAKGREELEKLKQK